MAGKSYNARKARAVSERNSKRGKYGNEVKAKLRMEHGQDLEVVGGFKTWGSMGDHVVELLVCADPTHIWIRVDGEFRKPRTMRGFYAALNRWAYRCRD